MVFINYLGAHRGEELNKQTGRKEEMPRDRFCWEQQSTDLSSSEASAALSRIQVKGERDPERVELEEEEEN